MGVSFERTLLKILRIQIILRKGISILLNCSLASMDDCTFVH